MLRLKRRRTPFYRFARNVWLWYHVKMGERDAVPGTRFHVYITGKQPTGDGVYSMHEYNKKLLQLGI
jgi:hypothetical protein